MTERDSRDGGAALTRRMREEARQVFLAGVAAADPRAAVRRALAENGLADSLLVAPVVRTIAFGKAACSMAAAVADVLGERTEGVGGGVSKGLVVTNRENLRAVPPFEVLAAGHPLPDAAGVEAARRVAELAARARPGDRTLVLISGGGSAILPAPVPPVTLADKLRVTQMLLASGATIHEVNAVRKHLSELKGGGLARRAAASSIDALVLSDVIGDDLSTIASGPTAADPSTFGECIALLRERRLWDELPERVVKRLQAGERGDVAETPKPGDGVFARVRHRIVGSNGQSLEAAARAARALGYEVCVVDRSLTGEAADVGAALAERCAARLRDVAQPLALLAGGETTVTLGAAIRPGGRNQELALSFALRASELVAEDSPAARWVFLSAGTDGIDGPTDAAGAVVDRGSIGRQLAACLDPQRGLTLHDSYRHHEAAGDLLRTGGTGTNVADLIVFLVATSGP